MGLKFKGVPLPETVPETVRMIFIHSRGEHPCHQTAFYYNARYEGSFFAEYVELPDGTRPQPGEDMRCGSCGQPISLNDFVSMDELKIEP